MVELVIKIPEEQYNLILESHKNGVADFVSKEMMMHSIKNGKPLPKEHGKLLIVSENKVKENQMDLDFSLQKWIGEVGLSDATVAIIEANKGE